ncbi:hypothetical protein ACS0TY_005086 [Phlomoides rotata]
MSFKSSSVNVNGHGDDFFFSEQVFVWTWFNARTYAFHFLFYMRIPPSLQQPTRPKSNWSIKISLCWPSSGIGGANFFRSSILIVIIVASLWYKIVWFLNKLVASYIALLIVREAPKSRSRFEKENSEVRVLSPRSTSSDSQIAKSNIASTFHSWLSYKIFRYVGERRDKALKELRDQLAAKQPGLPPSVEKQNFWETSGFKIVVPMSMLILSMLMTFTYTMRKLFSIRLEGGDGISMAHRADAVISNMDAEVAIEALVQYLEVEFLL